MTEIDEAETKRLYGLALLEHPDDPYKAALAVVGGDLPRALAMAREWTHDPDVVAAMDAVPDDERALKGVPTKNDLAREAWRRVQSTLDHETAFKGIEAIRKLMYDNKVGGTTVNNTLVDNRRVMVVTDHGTDAEWEAKLLEQQEKLIADAAEPIPAN